MNLTDVIVLPCTYYFGTSKLNPLQPLNNINVKSSTKSQRDVIPSSRQPRFTNHEFTIAITIRQIRLGPWRQ